MELAGEGSEQTIPMLWARVEPAASGSPRGTAVFTVRVCGGKSYFSLIHHGEKPHLIAWLGDILLRPNKRQTLEL